MALAYTFVTFPSVGLQTFYGILRRLPLSNVTFLILRSYDALHRYENCYVLTGRWPCMIGPYVRRLRVQESVSSVVTVLNANLH